MNAPPRWAGPDASCLDEFSWEQIAKETVEVYEAAIEHHRANKA